MYFRKVIFTTLLFLVSYNASSSNLFYGIPFISQEADVELTSGTGTITSTEDGTGIGIFADYYHRGTYRFNGTFSYVDYSNFYTTTLSASADYLIPVDKSLTFYVGVTGGAIGQVYDDASFSDMAASYLVGAQLGTIMFAGDQLMIELGYRLRSTDLETDLTAIPAVATVDELNEIYLGIHIIF